jgi:Arabinose-binding domain of AraC transcription regulator, N-term
MLHLRPSSPGAASGRRTSVLPFLDGNEDVGPDTTIGSAGPNIAHSSIAASHDVSQALEAAVRYRPLRRPAVEFEFVVGEDCLTLFIREPFDLGDVRTFILEAHVGMIERTMSAVTGELLVGIEYRFPYPPPAWAPEYSRWLAGTARFSAGRMELRVPKNILRPRSVTADARTRGAITLAAER